MDYYPAGFSVPPSSADSSAMDTLSGAESLSSMSLLRGRAEKRSKSTGGREVARPAAPAKAITGATSSTEFYALTDVETPKAPADESAKKDLFTRLLNGARLQNERAEAAEAENKRLRKLLEQSKSAHDTTKELAAQWVSQDGDKIDQLQDAVEREKNKQRELFDMAN